MQKRTERNYDRMALLLTMAIVAGLYLGMCGMLGFNLLEHSPYDSYTLQALRWREGHMDLGQDYPWLELAKFQGKIFVSFPPFPSLVMLPLTLFFGGNTPSQLVTFTCVLLSAAAGFMLCRRYKVSRSFSVLMGVFLTMGCNLAEFGLSGGVWNVAQAMSFALTIWAFYLCSSVRKTSMGAGLLCIAFAVGCRPFQALYVPTLLFMCWKNVGGAKLADLKKMLPIVLLPALVALAYALYNYARFANPLEFGHNYLPEFAEQRENGQFSVYYIADNWRNIWRLPRITSNGLEFPMAYGFAFWLCNPLFVLFAYSMVCAALARGMQAVDGIIGFTVCAHFFLLLMHGSFGGVQFGTRYLCDLVLAMFFVFARQTRFRNAPWQRRLESGIMLFGIGFNVYGAILFQKRLG